MTLAVYVNFILPLIVLAVGLSVAGASYALRRHRRARPRSRTRATVDPSVLLPNRKF